MNTQTRFSASHFRIVIAPLLLFFIVLPMGYADLESITDSISLHTYQLGAQANVRTAMNQHMIVYVWESDFKDGSDRAIAARIFDPKGEPLTDEFQVNSYTLGDQRDPEVAVLGEQFVVVWESRNQASSDSSWDLYYRIFNKEGQPITDEKQVNETTANQQKNPHIAVRPFGEEFVVVWQSLVRPDYDIFFRRFSPTGEPLSAEIKANNDTNGNYTVPRIALYEDNSILVVWEGKVAGKDEAFIRRFNAENEALDTGDVPLYSSPDKEPGDLDLALNPNTGSYTIVWEEKALQHLAVRGMVFQNTNEPMSDELLIISDAEGRNPRVAMNTLDEILVVWQTADDQGEDKIVGREYFQIQPVQDTVDFASGPSNQESPDVAGYDGFYSLVWTGLDPGESIGVWGRLYQMPTHGLFVDDYFLHDEQYRIN